MPRSACSASTAPASRRCCASWPGSTRSIPARPGPPTGARVGYLAQEPQLDPTKSVRENVMEGVAPQKAIVDRYNELADELFRRDRRRDDQAAGRDRGQGTVGSRLQGRSGDGRAALPARRRRRDEALRRRAAPRRAVPAAAGAARTAAARRADQPSRRRDR